MSRYYYGKSRGFKEGRDGVVGGMVSREEAREGAKLAKGIQE